MCSGSSGVPLRITNKFGVPKPLVTLATKEYYTKGASNYSVTELMGPPKVRRLQEQYDDAIEMDVSDMLWSMMGSAIHVVAERGQTENHITEERYHMEIDGVTISGAIDLQEDTVFGTIITDYKLTSAWAVMANKPEWAKQLNIYSYLVQKIRKKPVVALKICALVRDYNRHDTKEGYPKSPITMVDIDVWPLEKTEAYIKERLEMHRNAKMAAEFGDPLQDCSDEERWMSETVYAVKREGRKTAIRVLKSLDEATDMAEKEKGYVEVRRGEPKRCTGGYCSVSQWCKQHQQWKKENESN